MNDDIAVLISEAQKQPRLWKAFYALIGAVDISSVAVATQITTYKIKVDQLEKNQIKHEEREEKFADSFGNVDKMLERHTATIEELNHRMDRLENKAR